MSCAFRRSQTQDTLKSVLDMELKRVIVNLQSSRASGHDGVLPEFWKALASDEEALAVLLGLCNLCWSQKKIPTPWRQATVVTLFKKGDTSLPQNYRPISLLCVAYKVLAALLLARLKLGGVEGRLHDSQYGFRPRRGTSHALYLVRRLIDAAIDDREGSLYLVLLDWSKAFDRIKQDALLTALRRFGIPEPMIQMIGAIYDGRTFEVKDGSGVSSAHGQDAGIAQGCPLSPYLFIITMTVVLHDARKGRGSTTNAPYVITPDVAYADDTLVVGSSPKDVQTYLDCIARVGRQYGLELNLEKTILLRVRGRCDIYGSDGNPLVTRDEAVYLGGLVTTDGRPTRELTRRLGEARQTFRKLTQVWKHSCISRSRKHQIFDSCVVSKVLYGLESLQG